MPFIIWGSRGMTSHVDSGEFYCPACDQENVPYDLKQVREWFTLYFIPLFPVGSHQRYVECQQCRGTFTEEVFDIAPPSPIDRLIQYTLRDLGSGTSVQDAEEKLVDGGVERKKAKALLDELTTNKRTWDCQGCGHTYLKSVRKCTRCQ